MMQLMRHIHGKEKAAGFLSNLASELNKGKDAGEVVACSIVACRNGVAVEAPPPQVPTVTTKPKPSKARRGSSCSLEKNKSDPLKDAIMMAIILALILALILLLGEGTKVTLIRSFLLAG